MIVDSHVLLWAVDGKPENFSDRARALLLDPEVEKVVSAASVWEIALKQSTGKLEVRGPLLEFIRQMGVPVLPITDVHAYNVKDLPQHHGDPFDRMLVSQAQVERLPILSKDKRLRAYDVEVVW